VRFNGKRWAELTVTVEAGNFILEPA